LKALVVLIAGLPYFFPLFITFFSIDPVLIITKSIFPQVMIPHGGVKIFFWAFRFLIILCLALDLARMVSLLMILSVGGLQMIMEINYIIYRMAHPSQHPQEFSKYFKFYTALRVTLTITTNFNAPLLAQLMTLAMAAGVFCNFGTIRFQAALPLPLYIFFPIISVVLPIMLYCTFPDATNVFEDSKRLIRNWKVELLRSRPNRLNLKRLESVYPIRLFAGLGGFNFFHLKNSTKSTYFVNGIIQTTFNILLSLPQSFIDSLL